MSKRAKIVVRIIGVVIFLGSFVIGYVSLQDQLFNGVEMATMLLYGIGAYLMLGSEKSLLSWVK